MRARTAHRAPSPKQNEYKQYHSDAKSVNTTRRRRSFTCSFQQAIALSHTLLRARTLTYIHTLMYTRTLTYTHLHTHTLSFVYTDRHATVAHVVIVRSNDIGVWVGCIAIAGLARQYYNRNSRVRGNENICFVLLLY